MSILKERPGILPLLTAVTVGCTVGWWLTKLSFNTKLTTLEQYYTNQLSIISHKAQSDTTVAIQKMKIAQDIAAELDRHYSEELAHAQAENTALRTDIATGQRRMRIASADLATCQLTSSRNSSTSSMGDAAEIGLTAIAGRTIHDIRAGIISDQTKLDYLQHYVREVVQQCKIENTRRKHYEKT
ncbi:lysis protein [Photorhabdus sp. APURE]|uniref:lysis system i-spanin subunit Rz n=1 Tax=Photorhabdus aballayi TaxID=2991723 RepID=UPI00223CED4C|nr:lysis system i-spanin subunit Rz [Photorhabdus aballayi]MCW7550916.1 lysis protein [Photorhabdus aballayi]